MIERAALAERLRVLETVTDVELARLDVDKQLARLLEQVLELFGVDTAVVLLHEPASGELVATAALGLEEEVWQGVRVPVGQGFAGRVAALRQPVILDRVDETTVVNPLLWMKHVQVLLGVPIMASDQVLGVLHIGSMSLRRFTEHDSELLQLVADRLALTVQIHQTSSERTAAAALQRSLLPPRLPTVSGLTFAARYVPGTDTGVGGDWYDVFPLPGDRLGIVIGDVAGHGLSAAVIMGRLRSALRAYALDYADPGMVLGKLDRKAQHFEHHAMATIVYLVMDPAPQRVRLSLAGHLPPAMAAPDHSPDFLPVPVDPPIGFGLAITGRRTSTFDLPPEGVLVLYTDGLVESRDRLLDDGLAMLREAITVDPPGKVSARIMASLVGEHPAQDDVALLVLQRTSA